MSAGRLRSWRGRGCDVAELLSRQQERDRLRREDEEAEDLASQLLTLRFANYI